MPSARRMMTLGLIMLACLWEMSWWGLQRFYIDPPTHEERPGAWRLRGMAVREDLRGHGIGRLVLQDCIAHIASQGGTYLWCNARPPVLDFYRKLGFEAVGEEFYKPVTGPHYVIARSIP